MTKHKKRVSIDSLLVQRKAMIDKYNRLEAEKDIVYNKMEKQQEELYDKQVDLENKIEDVAEKLGVCLNFD